MKKPTTPNLFWLPITAAVAVLSSPASHGASYPATILADNPVAYYRLEELSGTTNFDATSNHFDGILTQATNQDGIAYPELGQPGISSNSVLFRKSDSLSGVQGKIDVPVNSTINPTTDGTNGAAFTAELWAEAISQPANYAVPLDDSSDFGQPAPWNSSAGWNFYQTVGPNSTWSYSIRPTPGFVGNGPAVTLLQWTHLVLAYDGTNTHFYVNGTRARSDAVGKFLANDGAEDLIFGSGPATGFIPFDGYIDEVAIYNYALSPTQVLTHYQVGTNNIVIPPTPYFLAQPQSTTNYHGTTAAFSVISGGTPPLHYQWKRGGALISGATNSSYSFVCHYPADDQATFSVVVSNAFGTLASGTATLTVLTNENILNAPVSITREVGSYAAFRVNAIGALPISYQWTVSTNAGATFDPIAGATNDTLWLANVQTNLDQSMYIANVTGPFATTPSAAATLSVVPRSVIVPITGYARVVVADNPVAYWRLDETNGTVATDAVGSFDGTYAGLLTDYVFGYPTGIPHETDGAIHVTNTAYMTVPYALELNPVTGPWSYEFWIQPTSQDTNTADAYSGFHTPISSEANPNAGSNLYGWNLYQHPQGYWTWNLFNGGGNGSFSSEFVDHPVFTGGWYHMVFTDDLTTMRWYSNNRLVLSIPVAGNFVPNGINGDPSVLGGPMTIGVRSDLVFGDWDGGVDDVAVYNYVLSPTQVSNHFNNSTHVSLVQSGNNVIVSWPVGTLQAAPNVTGTYTNVPGATSPYTNSISGHATYFRIKVQ